MKFVKETQHKETLNLYIACQYLIKIVELKFLKLKTSNLLLDIYISNYFSYFLFYFIFFFVGKTTSRQSYPGWRNLKENNHLTSITFLWSLIEEIWETFSDYGILMKSWMVTTIRYFVKKQD